MTTGKKFHFEYISNLTLVIRVQSGEYSSQNHQERRASCNLFATKILDVSFINAHIGKICMDF
jgi:hypothetical protein